MGKTNTPFRRRDVLCSAPRARHTSRAAAGDFTRPIGRISLKKPPYGGFFMSVLTYFDTMCLTHSHAFARVRANSFAFSRCTFALIRTHSHEYFCVCTSNFRTSGAGYTASIDFVKYDFFTKESLATRRKIW